MKKITANRSTTIMALAALMVGLFAASPSAMSGETDWYQWRGPNRNCIAPVSPKLANE